MVMIMKLKYLFDKAAQDIADKFGSGGVSQKENTAWGERIPFGSMPSLIRQAAGEGIVLLKNDNHTLPYHQDTRLAVFGRCQLDYFYVGYGSGGDVNAPYLVNIVDGLKNVGANLNKGLLGFYESWCRRNPVLHGFWGHWPMCYDEAPVTAEIVKNAAMESDHALIVIGRAAGEDRENKLIKGSYYLTDTEIELLDLVTLWFDKVTVLLDCGNVIDMSWTKRYAGKISAIVYAWQGGMESGNAVADILYGKVCPSGRLTDAIAVNYEDYPSAGYFGNEEFNPYSEDIFVGYRYFETFDRDKVLYPFGYGLSYTDFDLKTDKFAYDGKSVTAEITVKNVGKRKGKQVVQLYMRAPQGRLSKALMSLAAFEKTKELEPGESQTVTLSVPVYYLSSFDDTGVTGNMFAYVLEQGEYTFFAGENVRDNTEIGSFVLERDRVLEQLDEICGVKEPFERIRAGYENGRYVPKKETVTPSAPYLKNRIRKNLPDEIPRSEKKYTFLQVMSGEVSVDDFIACLSMEELEALTRGQGYMDSEQGVEGNAGAFGGSILSLRDKGVPAVITTDGPAGIRIKQYTSLLPCGTALASGWNTQLVYDLAAEMGKELKAKKSDVLLAPGMNIHRNVLCGRNFEYFSEDPILTGKMAAAFVNGIQTYGGSACPKHFACNNQETCRTKNDSRVSQRALREIYLKGFEICVKESQPLNIMTSYNKINGVWSHYNYDLVTTVLRGEWGYTGCVMTDWWMKRSKSPEFPNIRDNAYRARAQVDVLMPGGINKTDKKYKVDGSLLETVGTHGGLTVAEIQRSAKNVLNMIIRLKAKENDQ